MPSPISKIGGHTRFKFGRTVAAVNVNAVLRSRSLGSTKLWHKIAFYARKNLVRAYPHRSTTSALFLIPITPPFPSPRSPLRSPPLRARCYPLPAAKRRPQTQLGVWGALWTSGIRDRDRAPAEKSFVYVLSPDIVSGGNNFLAPNNIFMGAKSCNA